LSIAGVLGSLVAAFSIQSALAAPGDKAAQGGASIDVQPFTGLADGQTVTVTGHGFSPNATFGIEMCKAMPQGPNDCDQSAPLVTGSTGADGSFTRSVQVRKNINAGGAITCDGSGNCAVGASNFNEPAATQHAAAEAVGFSSGGGAGPSGSSSATGGNSGSGGRAGSGGTRPGSSASGPGGGVDCNAAAEAGSATGQEPAPASGSSAPGTGGGGGSSPLQAVASLSTPVRFAIAEGWVFAIVVGALIGFFAGPRALRRLKVLP
jgi:hypothetical protein